MSSLKLSDDLSSLSLDIVRYQFPEGGLGASDDNWLMIKTQVTCPDGTWEKEDPSLETYEVRRLATWLKEAAAGCPVRERLEFTEPNLAFRIIRNPRGLLVLRTFFRAESRPPWYRNDQLADAEDEPVDVRASGDLPGFPVSLTVSPEALLTAAEELTLDLTRWPIR